MVRELYPPVEGVNYISNKRKDGFPGNLELKFHSDLAHCECPGNTSTKCISSIQARNDLPSGLKEKVVHRRAVHCFAYGPNDDLYGLDEKLPHWSHRIA